MAQPRRGLRLALALSLLMHAAIFWLPHVRRAHEDVVVPPLTARLVAQPSLEAQQVVETSGGAPSTADGGIAGISGKRVKLATNTLRVMEKSATPIQFPKHLRLTFSVFRSVVGFKVGELNHQLDIAGDRYSLQATRYPAGMSSFLNDEQLIQTSEGRFYEHGLQPETFKEQKSSGISAHKTAVAFDWTARRLGFSNGGDIALPDDSQDVLSFMYQLSQVSLQSEIIDMPVSDGKQLSRHKIEVGIKETLSTPLGNISTRHLRQLHSQGEAYFEIWLGLEYRHLPVKFRRLDAEGNLIEEFVISDIRASDEDPPQ